MARTFEVAVLVGSLRQASISRQIAHALVASLPPSLHCRFVEIRDLPLYDEDLEADEPRPWRRFRDEIASADAVLFVTPEYNRSVPGALKNALDVGSRPGGKSVWSRRPAGIASVTPYQLGGFGANHALRQALVFLDVPAMQQPELYLSNAGALLDADGAPNTGAARELLTAFGVAFERWVTALAGGGAAEAWDAFLAQRHAIASAYSSGDAGPLDRILPEDGDATFFPPNGGHVTGARAVAARYDADAGHFSPGGDTKLEILQSGASGDLGFWTGFQGYEGKIGGDHVKMRLRITELFRREHGTWTLVHRHADPGAEANKP